MEYKIATISSQMNDDGDEFTLVELSDNRKLWFGEDDIRNLIKKSAIGVSHELNLEELYFVLKGGTLTGNIIDKTIGEEYTVDDNSTLVREGAWKDGITIKRDGKKITLKKGEKALPGDIAYVDVTGYRLDRNSNIDFEPNYQRLTLFFTKQKMVEKNVEKMMGILN